MKAMILSLGDGSGLWPLPSGGCEAGVPLLGRPILAWIARCLKQAGITELILLLNPTAQVPLQQELPCTVRRAPADGGTAQALLTCADELDGADFLLLPGDMLCSPDLDQPLRAHRKSRRPVSRLVYPTATAEGRRGRVIPLAQHPVKGWADTGAALVSPGIFPLLRAAEEPELFPQLEERTALGTVQAEGYFHRLRTPGELLQAAADLLGGICPCTFDDPPLRTGIWSRSPIPEGVELVPPCRIGANVTLGKGCLIGPHVCLEDGVTVGDHSLIQRSLLQSGVSVGSRATVYGALVCQGAALGHYTVLNEGASVGALASVGDNVILMEGVGVGPGLTVPPSVRLTQSLTAPIEPASPRPDPELTVEDMLKLGRKLGRCGTIGAGGEGFQGLLLARAFGCGAAAQGAAVVFHDARRPEQAAWLARFYGWPASVFVAEDGGAYLFDHTGGPLTCPPADGDGGEHEGSWDLLAGAGAAYEAATEREQPLPQACSAFHHRRGLDFL